MAVKAILHSRDIFTWCAIKFSYPDSVTRATLPLSRPIAVPQLLPVTSGGKQWRDVEHENGSAFVAGNCLSFCYFAASKSQTSADILGQTVTCRGNSYGVVMSSFRVSTFATYRTYPLALVLSFFLVALAREASKGRYKEK